MSRQAAKTLLDVVTRHAAEQDSALRQIQQMCPIEEFTEYKKMIGKSMGAMLLEVINPIVSRFPDLKPPQLN
jgi:hypothetical protein